MSHDFEPTEVEKEMLSHIKDIEVNRKQSELGNIISGAILDGQNQIHDLYKEKATAQEVEYRMRRSYTYWMNKLHQELQKAREIQDLYYELLHAVEHKHEGETRHQTALRYIQQTELPHLEGATAYQSELDQPTV